MRDKVRLYMTFFAVWISSFIWLLCAPRSVRAQEEIELYARSAVLMDGDSGRILYGREADTPMAMASTTKIMTCIVALEQADPDMICTVSANAASQPQVKLNMVQGDTFYLKDLLYSLMLESHNDTAVCIAETVGGSVEGFAAMMNEKAAQIGCRDTYYITPNGLDAEDESGQHRTTARELALVMRYCLTQSPKTQEFLKITQAPSYAFSNAEGNRSYNCTNHNALLSIFDGAVSGKTGFTGKAGYCYVGAVERGGKLLIVSLLACGWPNNKGYKWIDTKKLMNYGLEAFEKRTLVQSQYETAEIPVVGGRQENVATAVVYEAGRANAKTVLLRPDERVEVRVQMTDELAAPVEKGAFVGAVSYLVDGIAYAHYPVVAVSAVPVWNYTSCLRELAGKLLFKYLP